MQRGGNLLTRTGAGRSQEQGAGPQQSAELQFSYLGWWAPHDTQDGDSNRKSNLGNGSVSWQTRLQLVAAEITWRTHIIYTGAELHPLPPLWREESAHVLEGKICNVRGERKAAVTTSLPVALLRLTICYWPNIDLPGFWVDSAVFSESSFTPHLFHLPSQ